MKEPKKERYNLMQRSTKQESHVNGLTFISVEVNISSVDWAFTLTCIFFHQLQMNKKNFVMCLELLLCIYLNRENTF